MCEASWRACGGVGTSIEAICSVRQTSCGSERAFCYAEGKPLEAATITDAASLDSEAFQEAVRGFLDGETADFDRYRQAFESEDDYQKPLERDQRRSPGCGRFVAYWRSADFGYSLNSQSQFRLNHGSAQSPALPLSPLLLFILRIPLLARCLKPTRKTGGLTCRSFLKNPLCLSRSAGTLPRGYRRQRDEVQFFE